jgi:hypothetical protein
MEKPSNIEKKWIQLLESAEQEMAIQAIYEIRNAGSVKMLPILFGMIRKETPVAVRTEIFNLLGELKSRDAIPHIVMSLEKIDFGEYLPAFLAACWQSGLDFSDHLHLFAKLFIDGDYITSLEAFTVLEESFPNATDEARMECIRYLKQAEYLVMDEKLPLFRELRKVIESI